MCSVSTQFGRNCMRTPVFAGGVLARYAASSQCLMGYKGRTLGVVLQGNVQSVQLLAAASLFRRLLHAVHHVNPAVPSPA